MTRNYERPLTPDELAARSDEDIDTGDIPPLDETFWAKATIREPRTKAVVSLRLPDHVIEHFKARYPKGYTSRMAEVLASYVEHAER